MFPGRIAYHDINDVEAFCLRIVHRSGLELAWHERDDLLAYLVETCWELSRVYRPGGIRFSTYANTILSRRTVDWVRQYRGRDSRARNPGQRVQLLSLGDELAESHIASLVDVTPPRSTDLMRALRSRGSTSAGRDDTVGEGEDGKAA